MKPKIVVIGSANTDMVVKVRHLPGPGETVLGDRAVTTRGGKGANQAIAALRLGADVTFIARLGCDTFGKDSVDAYRHEGLNIDHIIWDDEVSSGLALITVDQNGENQITVAPGANARLSPKDIESVQSIVKDADFLLLQLEIPLATVEAAADLAESCGVRAILNPAPAQNIPASLLRKVNVLTPNETEAIALLGDYPYKPGDLALSLKKKFDIRNVVVTLGKEGALLASENGINLVEGNPFPVESIDATGAGDAFNGGLAVALARGDDIEAAVRYANIVGALATTRIGAQCSLPTTREVEIFLRENRRKVAFR